MTASKDYSKIHLCVHKVKKTEAEGLLHQEEDEYGNSLEKTKKHLASCFGAAYLLQGPLPKCSKIMRETMGSQRNNVSWRHACLLRSCLMESVKPIVNPCDFPTHLKE